MPVPLPPPQPDTQTVQWSMDAGVLAPSATAVQAGEVEVQAGVGIGPTSVGVDGAVSASPFTRF